MGHFEVNEILVDSQHGFRAKRSTETQLIVTIDDIARALDKGESIHMAIVDFSKAFDKVAFSGGTRGGHGGANAPPVRGFAPPLAPPVRMGFFFFFLLFFFFYLCRKSHQSPI